MTKRYLSATLGMLDWLETTTASARFARKLSYNAIVTIECLQGLAKYLVLIVS